MSANETADNLEASRAPFVEHLRELRNRLIISIIAIVIGFLIAWNWREEVFLMLLEPLKIAAAGSSDGQIYHRDITESFFVLLKTSLFSGVIIAIPVIMYQIWLFIAPGLYANERRTAIPFVVFSTICFLGGGWFCYKLILPFAYEFLLAFASDVSQPQLMMQEYLSVTTKLILAFGAIFEMPIITTFLAKMGVVNHMMMLRFWRYAVVICFIVGAMLTPPDLISQVMLAGPMMLLYFISVGCAYIFGPRGDQLKTQEDSNGETS